MHLAKPSYPSYVVRKKQDGEKPLSQKDWEARLNGKTNDKPKTKDDEGDDGNLVSDVKDYLKDLTGRLKGVPTAVKSAIAAAPKVAQQVLANKAFRDSAFKSIGSALRNSPKTLVSSVVSSFKAEVAAAATVGRATKKLMTGKKLNRNERQEFYKGMTGLAAMALTANAGRFFVKAFVKDFAKQVAIGVVGDLAHEVADFQGLVNDHSDMLDIVKTIGTFVSKGRVASDAEGEDDTDDALQALSAVVIARIRDALDKGLSNDEVDDMLRGNTKDPDFTEDWGPKTSDKSKGKQGSLRARTIRLAKGNLALRQHLLPILVIGTK